jgi:hypothetical protein
LHKTRRAFNTGTKKLVNEARNAVEDFGGRFFEYKIVGKEKLLF